MWSVVTDYFGQQKIPVFLAVGAFMSIMALQQYVDVTYVSTADAEQTMSSLSKKIDGNGKMMRDHIDQYEFKENQKAIGVKKDQLFNLEQWVAVNGGNEMTAARKHELTEELDNLKDVKACLISGNNNCQ